jgi:methionyl-tRNA formyltransferase
VLQPRRVREPEAHQALERLGHELQVVVAYGQILPRSVIDIAPHGTVNVHASLLPKLRGAAPVQWAIATGETETGVSTMLIDEGLDTGPVLLQRGTPIGPDETASELEPRLSRLGAELLIETVRGMEDGSLSPTPQDHERATHAPLLKKEDGELDWGLTARELHCRVRGFHPWPGAFTSLEGRALKILRARPATPPPSSPATPPGTLLAVDADGILVSCGERTCLLVQEVQPESRRGMPAAAFAAGARVRPGARLG